MPWQFENSRVISCYKKTKFLFIVLLSIALSLLASCTTMDQETFQMAFNSAYAPDKNIQGPQKGKVLVYGYLARIDAKGRCDLIFRDQKTKKQIHLSVVQSVFENVPEKYFLFEIPEGTYELLGFEYFDTTFAVSYIYKYYWFSYEGLKSIQKLGRKPNKSEYESADHDTITLNADEIYYIGNWELNSNFPILSKNRDPVQRMVSKDYPKLNLNHSKTLIPEITIPNEK